VHNLYGPTEGTVLVTAGRVLTGLDGDPTPAIGRPISGSRVYVLDSWLRPVPPGVPGELCIAGQALARGYAGASGLTAERFLPDPLSSAPGSRLYRTGDLARHRRDGSLEFVGRLDTQVKIRGFRVEPAEAEAVLHQHPGVRMAAVVAVETLAGDRQLAAHVVPEPGLEVTAADLRRFLGDRLPVYLLPASIRLVPELPLTHNGKVDRGRLVAEGPSSRTSSAAYAPPRDALEELLAGIWADALAGDGASGAPPIGIHDNFFELGGHSLAAVRVMLRIYDALRSDLSLQALFEAPTIAELSTWLRERSAAAAEPIRTLARRQSSPAAER
jgi:acyl carrier protein